MCGIAGKIGQDVRGFHEAVRAMVARMIHRGPDHHAVVELDGSAVFGHCRLSIIDLSAAANQPMSTADGRYVLSYNGEVYNFADLRRELETLGVRFHTQSDTEVVLAAFVQWGTACFDRFNGMFALAIWDRANRELTLARDRFGKKPLYYTTLGGPFSFASELSALEADPALRPKLKVSVAGLNHYLAMGYVLSPLTVYRDVFNLEPATFLRVKDGRIVEKTRYWEYRNAFSRQAATTEAEAADGLLSRLDAAVKSRLVSDVPVGAFLSGGLDSSGIAALAKRHLGYELHTFSIGFELEDYNESEAARLVASHVATVHHERILQSRDIASIIDGAIDDYDGPFSDTSLVPTVFLARFARQFVTVALSGDGADEIFGGYATHRADLLHHRLRRLPRWFRAGLAGNLSRIPTTRTKVGLAYKANQFAKGVARDYQAAHFAWRELHSEVERLDIIGQEHAEEIRESDPIAAFRRYYDEVPDLDRLSQHLYVDAKTWLADDILMKVDRASMAASLEVRCPFLDRELVEYVAGLPSELKIRHGEQKYLLRRVLAPYLPHSTVTKRKVGFNAPINTWTGHRGDDEFRYFNRYVGVRKGLLTSSTPDMALASTVIA